MELQLWREGGNNGEWNGGKLHCILLVASRRGVDKYIECFLASGREKKYTKCTLRTENITYLIKAHSGEHKSTNHVHVHENTSTLTV